MSERTVPPLRLLFGGRCAFGRYYSEHHRKCVEGGKKCEWYLAEAYDAKLFAGTMLWP